MERQAAKVLLYVTDSVLMWLLCFTACSELQATPEPVLHVLHVAQAITCT